MCHIDVKEFAESKSNTCSMDANLISGVIGNKYIWIDSRISKALSMPVWWSLGPYHLSMLTPHAALTVFLYFLLIFDMLIQVNQKYVLAPSPISTYFFSKWPSQQTHPQGPNFQIGPYQGKCNTTTSSKRVHNYI